MIVIYVNLWRRKKLLQPYKPKDEFYILIETIAMGFLRIKNSHSFLACTRRYSVKSEFNLSEVVYGFRYV